MWRDIRVRRQSCPGPIEPYAAQTESLRRADVELEVVPDHPRIHGGHAKTSQRLPVDFFVGLSVTHLPFDQNDVEPTREVVTRDLVALVPSVAVRDERQRHPSLALASEAIGRLREQPPGRATPLRVEGRNRLRRARIRLAARLEGARRDLRPRAEHVDALAPLPLGVAPEPLTRVRERRQQHSPLDVRRRRLTRRRPADVNTARVVKQRVVEIEQQGLQAPLSTSVRSWRGSRTRSVSVARASTLATVAVANMAPKPTRSTSTPAAMGAAKAIGVMALAPTPM